jgi:hypothetical protein
MDMIRQGQIQDAKTALALLYTAAYRMRSAEQRG